MPGDTGDQKDIFTILPPNPRIFARIRGSCGPFLGGNPQMWVGEGGISWMEHRHTQKREEFTTVARNPWSILMHG